MTQSVWLNTFGKRANLMLNEIKALKLKGTDGTINFNEMTLVIMSSVQEIQRLQKVNDDLVKVLDVKEKQLEKLGHVNG